MQSETGVPSSHQLKSYVGYKSRLKLAARAVLSADAGLLVCDRNAMYDAGKEYYLRTSEHIGWIGWIVFGLD